ncbi:hypothetical protein [Rathayibacter rathayi]|nr:hypothetical protein [Rathayibacter rathayi]
MVDEIAGLMTFCARPAGYAQSLLVQLTEVANGCSRYVHAVRWS